TQLIQINRRIRAGSSPAFGTKNDCDNRKTYNNQYVVQ
ncbi:hypothetical protein HUSEC_24546, partial [Escherichia coli O104:H4 str. LB226692]